MSEREMKSTRYRVVGGLAAVIVAALWLGCTKTDEKKIPDSPTATLPVPADDGLDSIPGADPVKTRAYLAQLRPHWRTAAPDSAILDCTGPNAHVPVHVRLVTHERSYKIDTEAILKRNPSNHTRGHIIMKIVNDDPVACSDIGLGPRDSVYLWAGIAENAKRSFSVFRINQQGTATMLVRAKSGIHCTRPDTVRESKAHTIEAATCEPDSTGKIVLYAEGPLNVKDSLGPLHDQGLWYACSGGCCQASNFGN